MYLIYCFFFASLMWLLAKNKQVLWVRRVEMQRKGVGGGCQNRKKDNIVYFLKIDEDYITFDRKLAEFHIIVGKF